MIVLLRDLRLRRRLHRLPRRRRARPRSTPPSTSSRSPRCIVFSVIAIGYRVNHPEGTRGLDARSERQRHQHRALPSDAKGAAGQGRRRATSSIEKNAGRQRTSRSRSPTRADSRDADACPTRPTPKAPRFTQFQYHTSAASVVAPHAFSYMIIQACIAILILVGFESVTSMGEEAKNAKRDIPRAIILSLLIQGVFCYLIEYFAANYLLNNGYQVSNALRLGGADRRHDDHRRHVALRQPGGRQGVHARAGPHGVPGAHRHDALVHEHRRARDLRDGPRRRSAASTSACCTARS